MKRRLFLCGVAVVGTATRPAFAGSYLDRAALLVHESATASYFLRKRLYDLESAKLVHGLALARVQFASAMDVPAEVQQAHPHLLLMLENHERAAAAAVERRASDFLRAHSLALDEQGLFVTILKHLGWTLPKLKI